MEQLKQLCGRFFGKKSVAVILGLLGLCSPSSLWAEKLDTTFVLDMVVDTTPSYYYTQYNNAGQIIECGTGRRKLSNYPYSSYFSYAVHRINIGYVTNEARNVVDTIYYDVDRCREFDIHNIDSLFAVLRPAYKGGSYRLNFGSSGMLCSIRTNTIWYSVETHGSIDYSEDGILRSITYNQMDHGGGADHAYYDYNARYDEYGNITSIAESYGTYHQGGSSWSYGTSTESIYNNEYDGKGNLIALTESYSYRETGYSTYIDSSVILYKEEHQYDDSGTRRVKTVRYDFRDGAFVVKDSTIYSYEHALREGEACLLSIMVRGNQIDSFSSDKYNYDFSGNPSYYIMDQNDIKYITPFGSSVEEFSYDSETRQLKISVLGSGSSRDSSNMNTYTVKFSTPESYITSMTNNGNPVESFSRDKYEYDFMDSTSFWRGSLDYEYSPGSIVEKNYDYSTNTLSISVYGANFSQDSSNMNIYTIKFSTPRAYIISMKNNGNPVESFSYDKYEYDFMDSTSFWIGSLDYEYSPGATVEKSYDYSTNTLSISVYGANSDQDPDNINVYSIHCKSPESYLTSLSFNGSPVEDFSPDKFEYTFDDIYSPQERTITYTTSPGSRVTNSDSGKSLRVTVINELTRQEKVYIIVYSTRDACLTSLSINGNPVKDFSQDKYEYDFSDSLEYQEGSVSYTLPQFGVEVNGKLIKPDDDDYWGKVFYENYVRNYFNYRLGVLEIRVICEMKLVRDFGRYEVVGSSEEIYTIKFKKPKPESFLTSMELDGTPIDTFSVDKYIYDLSDYSFSAVEFNNAIYNTKYLNVSNASGSSYDISLSKPNDSNDGINFSTLKWIKSKYSTFDVSYEEETGVVAITVKGADYEEDSSNFHVYKILTSKIDSLSIDSFQVVYPRGGWSNSVKVIAGEHEYKAFSPLPTDFTYNLTSRSWRVSSNIDVTAGIQYSEEAHTIYYIFSHKTIQSLVDTYYVVLQPCVISIYTDDNSACEAVDKFEHNIVGEYKPGIFKYVLPAGVVATESYDDSTNILTLTARFKTGDTTAKTEYHIHFIHPSISSLTINGEALDTFSADVHDYWFDTEYNPDVVSYTLPDGVAAMESFDDSTNILMVRLASSDAIGTVAYRLHFRPVDGVDDFLGDQVSLYVMDKAICVDGATEPIFVYDLRGTFVGTGRGEEVRIPVRQTGVYVVKAGRKAAKVVVK